MPRIRVLVVDDAVVVRRMVTEAIGADPELEVVGQAVNGRQAIEKIQQHQPDLVTMDVEMPEMDGLQALAVIKKQWPKLPVIMFSTMTERGARVTLDALALGASDYITKPSNTGGMSATQARLKDELIPRIKSLCRRTVSIPTPSALRPAAPAPRPRTLSKIALVTIGISTGGPNALSAVLPMLPANLSAPVVIVQHMPAFFTSLLAERLASQCKLKVQEGKAGMTLTPGGVWLAPGDFHVTVERRAGQLTLQTNQGPPENSCRPAVDVLFRSAAEVCGDQVLAVVMTGMGQDGLKGCERIRARNGQVIVQDEASSVVWGMPRFVARAGLAERILPLAQLPKEIVDRVGTTMSSGARTPLFRGVTP